MNEFAIYVGSSEVKDKQYPLLYGMTGFAYLHSAAFFKFFPHGTLHSFLVKRSELYCVDDQHDLRIKSCR